MATHTSARARTHSEMGPLTLAEKPEEQACGRPSAATSGGGHGNGVALATGGKFSWSEVVDHIHEEHALMERAIRAKDVNLIVLVHNRLRELAKLLEGMSPMVAPSHVGHVGHVGPDRNRSATDGPPLRPQEVIDVIKCGKWDVHRDTMKEVLMLLESCLTPIDRLT